MHIHINLLNGEALDFSLKEKSITIGRSSKCDIVVPHEGMSRQHCLLEVENGEVFITDLASTNGIFINGEKIEPNIRIRYATYFSLSFGAVQSMTVDIDDKTSASFIEKDEMVAANEGPLTKTKLQPPRQESSTEITPKQAYKPQYMKAKESRFQSLFINLLALLIVLGAAYWYLTKEEVPSEVIPEEISSETVPQ